MKKSFFPKKIQKKSRGVAVIFTLGILGLLTVIALGFASTALLNRKIAENTSSADYARHIAKNIALARARWAVISNAQTNVIYACMPEAYAALYSAENGSNSQDFLYKMDTVLDGVEIYRITDDSGNIKNNTARWQYVTDPNDSNRIIGRYAYAVVPDFGRMDPSVNIGTAADAANRYGRSEKELKLPGTAWSGIPNIGSNRWSSFTEIMNTLGITDKNTKKTFFNDGISIKQHSEPEIFWVDLNQDAKRTPNEMFLRFNLTRDWVNTTVADLTGESAEPLTRATAGSAQSSNCIPWLKYWDYGINSDWTKDVIKNQIAANIIQYNLPGPDDTDAHKTISDKMGDADDWLTSPPTYAGIGRHPMLNEIGFMIRVRTEVTHTPPTTPSEGKMSCTYTPVYYITIDAGAELIYPFGPGSELANSEIKFSGTSSDSKPKMLMKFVLRKFLKSGGSPNLQSTVDNLGNNLIVDGILNQQMVHSDIDRIIVQTNGEINKLIDSSTVITQMSEEGFAWTNCDITLETGDWNASPAYTKAGSFWKENKTGKQQTLRIPIRSFTMTTNTSVGTADQIAAAMARRMTIEWERFAPGNVVLKYNGVQRDIAQLDEKTPPNMTDMATEKVWFVSYETTDPLVNHYKTDWKSTANGPVVWNETSSLKNDYPGTLYASGDETETSHVNSTVTGKLPNLTINGTTIQETATDPAYTTAKRLSSSYIRHGQMKSLWELAFISRAEAFRTLNLARAKIFDPTNISNLKAGAFADGDANILDQVKLSDSNTEDSFEKYGKINLNSKIHNVFSKLFRTDVKWYESLKVSDQTDQFSTTSTDSTSVCSNTTCSSTSCLAHLLQARSSILPFSNRSDLLMDPDDANIEKYIGYSTLSDTTKNQLKDAQADLRDFLLKAGDTALCKTEKEQYAARFMNLFSTEPVTRVYIIVLAQTIRDVGGAPVFVDWNGDGEYSPSAVEIPVSDDSKMKKFLRTGYVRKKLYSDTEYEKIGSVESVNETITSTTVGTYDYGADKITGETKLVVEMQKMADKWKITGYRYVE